MAKEVKEHGTKTKLLIQLGSPYTAVQWPTISLADQNLIRALLLELLTPIALFRSQKDESSTSKGRRDRKRKRGEGSKLRSSMPTQCESPPAHRPQIPAIKARLTIGLNATSRYLSDQSRCRVPAPLLHLEPYRDVTSKVTRKSSPRANRVPSNVTSQKASDIDLHTRPPLAAVFLPQTPNYQLLHAHLPLAALTASADLASQRKTRLVPLAASAEKKLAEVLGIPRVGVLGLFEETEGASGLIELIREKVELTKVPWLDDAIETTYKEVNVTMEEKLCPNPMKKPPPDRAASYKLNSNITPKMK